MKTSLLHHTIWRRAAGRSADPERVRRLLRLLEGLPGARALERVEPELARVVCALLSGSQAMGEALVACPELLSVLNLTQLREPRQEQNLRWELHELLKPARARGDVAGALGVVRRFKQREMLRIAARDLGGLADTPTVIKEISDVADVCLGEVLEECLNCLRDRHGQPYHQDPEAGWVSTEFCVLGMGKLGGQELNYSSDVDVLFVYSEEGGVFRDAPRRGASPLMTNHQFYRKLAEMFIAEVGRLSSDGTLYRIDLRLRPEGQAGPLVRSLPSYETYYAQWGQTWERMMLIKARRVAGSRSLAGEFLEMVQSFRYPRSLTPHALGEMAAMKQRLEDEVVRSGELDRNVKLGRGGIREIEFIVQSLQMLHGGRNPFLQGAQTLPILDKLAQYRLLKPPEAQSLAEAYIFLRKVEHRLQMEQNRQTHTIPLDSDSRERLARLMGYTTWQAFENARAGHAGRVRDLYERLLKSEESSPAALLPREFESAQAEWTKLLPMRCFRDPEKAFKLLREFALGPGYGHVSARTTELAWRLIPRLIAMCPIKSALDGPLGEEEAAVLGTDQMPARLSDPDRVLARLDTFISAYGARATLYEVWANNPSLFELIILLFDRSEFLAETAIRTPDMVEELMLSGHLRRRKSAPEILRELQMGRTDADQRLWLRQYHKSEFMRIGLRHILGLADCEQNFEELSALADACLQYALEIVMERRRLKSPPFAIIGLGKLGGREIDYGSDLDIVFVAPPARRGLDRLQGMAAEVMDLLAAPTELGVAFRMDARLRPDGEKGLLVNTLTAFEEYYRRRARLWELQALTRPRSVAGDAEVGAAFLRLAAVLTNFTPDNVQAGFVLPSGAAVAGFKPTRRRGNAVADQVTSGLSCYAPDWKKQVHLMRLRIEKERTPPGKDVLAFKTGRGGLVDAEFIAQAICLEQGWQEPNTLKALERAVSAGVLSAADGQELLPNYRQLRRMEAILRRWSYEGEAVLPDDPAPLYRVAVRCGWRNAAEFTRALAGWRAALRGVYCRYFQV